ncbi:hypothetical protein PI125_g12971 [Phytophthora idaei]|nr:hypothetical protein PI125_g12971 [Phytophthora idaei]KAG3154032.1 hypothetical protein PI126_g9818 [Phytophthora idaei]
MLTASKSLAMPCLDILAIHGQQRSLSSSNQLQCKLQAGLHSSLVYQQIDARLRGRTGRGAAAKWARSAGAEPVDDAVLVKVMVTRKLHEWLSFVLGGVLLVQANATHWFSGLIVLVRLR